MFCSPHFKCSIVQMLHYFVKYQVWTIGATIQEKFFVWLWIFWSHFWDSVFERWHLWAINLLAPSMLQWKQHEHLLSSIPGHTLQQRASHLPPTWEVNPAAPRVSTAESVRSETGRTSKVTDTHVNRKRSAEVKRSILIDRSIDRFLPTRCLNQ